MTTYLKIIVVIVTLAVPIALIASCGSAATSSVAATNTSSSTPAPSATSTPDALAASRDLFKTNCAKCHQDSGKGGKVTVDGKQINAHDLTSDKMKKRDDDKFRDDILEGSPDDGMPAFKGKLTDAQIDDIIKYIRTELQK